MIGHSFTRPPETTFKKYPLYTTNHRWNRGGRSCTTYVKLLEKETGMINYVLLQLAKNREDWRRFVAGKIDALGKAIRNN